MSTLRQKYVNIYWCWKALKQRTLNPKCRAYKNYGARGISVCDEWLEFEPFCEWALKNGWKNGFELDRIDNERGYSPNNCRWVSRRENINNRRKTVFITVDGVTKALTNWADKIGCPRGTLSGWIRKHSMEYAVDRIREALCEGYTQNDFSRNHIAKQVVCIETGKLFTSIKEASRQMNLNSGNISKAIKDGKATCGFHFRELLPTSTCNGDAKQSVAQQRSVVV